MFEFLGVSIRNKDGVLLIIIAALASFMLFLVDLLVDRSGALGRLASFFVSIFLLTIFVVVGIKVGHSAKLLKKNEFYYQP